MVFWWGLTDFGDSAAMLPAAALIAAWLAGGRAWRRLALWCGGFALLSLLVALSKLAFLGWGVGSQDLDFTGISGHTALAVSILSVGAAVSLADRPPALRWGGVALGAALGLAIGLSRLALHVHSVSEVAAGAALGGTLSAIYFWGAAHANPARLRPAALGGALLLTLGLIHGERAPTQDLLTRMALSLSGHAVPHSRADWQAPQLAQHPREAAASIGN
jgi:membrane-associated phospholipid phosphatase